MTTDMPEHRFLGARRAEGFDEPADVEPAIDRPPIDPAEGWDRFSTPTGASPATAVPWPTNQPHRETPATWGAKRHLVKIASLGLASAKPSNAERAHREAERVIRSASWPRAVRIAVVNPKGGVGKTPTAIILAGLLARIRGGGVVVWDAGDAAGSLAVRTEGSQTACVSDVAANPDAYSTPGTINSAVARQSSFAAVIASRRPREFSAADVQSVMTALDQSFSVSVADTGNLPHSPAFNYVAGHSDAIVIPTTVTRDSIDRTVDVLRRLRAIPVVGLAQRATIVVNRGVSGESAAAFHVHEIFEHQGVGAVIDVPFDRAIAANGELRLDELSHNSRAAWTQAAAAMVSSIVIDQGA